MQVRKMIATIITALLATAPVAAQTGAAALESGHLPTPVFWAAAISSFLGFLFGSIPPNERDRGVKFDLAGAILWSWAGACLCGGLSLYLVTGHWTPAVYAVAIGVFVSAIRLLSTRPPRVPRGADLQPGINRAQGDSPRAKFKAAKRLYNRASFRKESGYYATRSPLDYRYGTVGAPAAVLDLLRQGLEGASPDLFDILIVLVRELPGEPGEPAVIVVRGTANLRAIKTEPDGLTLPGCSAKIPAASVAGMVGYAWR